MVLKSAKNLPVDNHDGIIMVNKHNLAYADFLPPKTVTFYSVPVF